MTRTPEPAMTVRDVTGYLNVNEKRIYRLASRGKLSAFEIAGAGRFLAGDVDAWIEQQKRDVGGQQRLRAAAKGDA